MLERALGERGFRQPSRPIAAPAPTYTLTAVQADAILRMTLGQLVNLEQEKLGGEYQQLLDEIAEYQRILSDDAIIRGIIRDDLLELTQEARRRAPHRNQRRGGRLRSTWRT